MDFGIDSDSDDDEDRIDFSINNKSALSKGKGKAKGNEKVESEAMRKVSLSFGSLGSQNCLSCLVYCLLFPVDSTLLFSSLTSSHAFFISLKKPG